MAELINSYPFIFGFAACAILMTIIVLIGGIFKFKNKRSIVLHSIFLVIVSLGISFIVLKQDKISETELKHILDMAEIEAEKAEGQRVQSLMPLMAEVLEGVRAELATSADNTLSEYTINRIAALSKDLRPYKRIAVDSLVPGTFSPERAQFLLQIINLGIDTSSLEKIFSRSDFSHVLLEKAQLNKTYLKGVHLSHSYLREADLSGAMMDGALLNSADLWGAKMESVSMVGAELKRANLQWVQMNDADLRGANMEGALMNSAQLRRALLDSAKINWVEFRNGHLDGASMVGAELKGAFIDNTSIKGAKLTGTVLGFLSVGNVDWIESLESWDVKDAKDIKENYKTVTADLKGRQIVQLRSK